MVLKQLAEFTGVHEQTLLRWLRAGLLVHDRIGRSYVFDEAAVQAAIALRDSDLGGRNVYPQAQEPDDRFESIEDAAARIGKHVRTVWRWVAPSTGEPKLQGFRRGRLDVVVLRAEVDELIARRSSRAIATDARVHMDEYSQESPVEAA